jgi:hypothetical protein
LLGYAVAMTMLFFFQDERPQNVSQVAQVPPCATAAIPHFAGPLGPILRRDVVVAAFEFHQLLKVGEANYFFIPRNGGEFGFRQDHVLARLDRTAIAEDALLGCGALAATKRNFKWPLLLTYV